MRYEKSDLSEGENNEVNRMGGEKIGDCGYGIGYTTVLNKEGVIGLCRRKGLRRHDDMRERINRIDEYIGD
ncbi:hypothetical protein [Staphylococcus epidermidis]|uniref:hypothetical protein n=1 Tax=Staphylococcus epidermidis TaxID=1282 RepID=UPI0011A68DC1|nr:hypothetical protein [Staphylococcus epidermidis]